MFRGNWLARHGVTAVKNVGEIKARSSGTSSDQWLKWYSTINVIVATIIGFCSNGLFLRELFQVSQVCWSPVASHILTCMGLEGADQSITKLLLLAAAATNTTTIAITFCLTGLLFRSYGLFLLELFQVRPATFWIAVWPRQTV